MRGYPHHRGVPPTKPFIKRTKFSEPRLSLPAGWRSVTVDLVTQGVQFSPPLLPYIPITLKSLIYKGRVSLPA